MATLESEIARLSEKYLPIACEILAEAIRIPEDFREEDKNRSDGYHTGMSNLEGPRVEYLMKKIVEIGAVEKAEDCYFDEVGNLVWVVEDKEDGIDSNDKKVIYFDGHTDTVAALPEEWKAKLGEGVDAFKGMVDPEKVSEEALRACLVNPPAKDLWEHFIFGRGSTDQLSGVVSQIIATKICLELKHLGALKGVIIRSMGTICEEDNDGAGPMHLMRKVLPNAEKAQVPDVFIFTEGTGNSERSALAIYRGQRGRMQIQVDVVGRSCHGSMPSTGLNPLEWGSRILAQCTEQVEKGEGLKDNEFLGKGSRTASWCNIETPSLCAVPEKFSFRFDRRITVGEDPKECVKIIEDLPAVAAAREAGLKVDVFLPVYPKPTWKGVCLNNEEVYMPWETPEDHEAVKAAVSCYENVIAPYIDDEQVKNSNKMLVKEPLVDRFIFSTDGVGVPVESSNTSINHEGKRWIDNGVVKHCAMLGFGPGTEHCAHRIGEYVSKLEIQHSCSWLAKFPSSYVEECSK